MFLEFLQQRSSWQLKLSAIRKEKYDNLNQTRDAQRLKYLCGSTIVKSASEIVEVTVFVINLN